MSCDAIPVGRRFANFVFSTVSPTPQRIVDPAVNPGGLIIRTLHVSLPPGTAGAIFLYAETAVRAPTTMQIDRRIFLDWAYSGQAGVDAFFILPYQLYLGPGLGIYMACNQPNGTIIMTYDL